MYSIFLLTKKAIFEVKIEALFSLAAIFFLINIFQNWTIKH